MSSVLSIWYYPRFAAAPTHSHVCMHKLYNDGRDRHHEGGSTRPSKPVCLKGYHSLSLQCAGDFGYCTAIVDNKRYT